MGYATIAILHTQRNVLQNLLLAPVVGMAITLLPVFTLNRAGIPVAFFAIYLSVILLIVALGVLLRVRPVFSIRQYLPFIGVFVFAALLTGWPLLLYGFEWLGNTNNDMLTLSNAAQYFLNNGFFDGPRVEDLINGSDYSQTSWYLYVLDMHRVGNELLLSWAAGLTLHRPDQIFMPLALALHLVLISSTGALVLQSRRFRLAALLSCFLLGLSALSTWAVFIQLSSQIGGLSLLIGAATLLLREYGNWTKRNTVLRAILAGLLMAAMLLYYPEMLPFLALSCGIFWLLTLIKNKSFIGVPWLFLGLVFIVCALILNTQLVAAMVHLSGAVSGGVSNAAFDVSAFPQFFKPSGLPILWGLAGFGQALIDPWGSILIATGAVLLLSVFISASWQSYLRTPIAIITWVMLVLLARLFVTHSGFGVFKMAFYVQPFILATIVISWFAIVKNPILRVFPILLLGLASGLTQKDYSTVSADRSMAAAEVWRGSKSGIKNEFDQVLTSVPSNHIIIDTSNFFLARLQAIQAKGKELDIAFFDMVGWSLSPPNATIIAAQNLLKPSLMKKYGEITQLMRDQRNIKYAPSKFNLHENQGKELNAFDARRQPLNGDDWLIAATGMQTVFNRRQYGDLKENFASLPIKNASNHLFFVNSSLGAPHYLAAGDVTSFNQLEPDLYFPDKTMSAVGRHLLFQAVNPSPNSRLALEITSTYKADGVNKLPPASAVGSSRQAFPLVGRGSARVFSPPLTPQWIEGSPYFSVDMNEKGASFQSKETGLMKLYGESIQIDQRRVVVFARNISLISEADYQDLSPPVSISKFPDDLTNTSLEYSGVYEDGWASEASFFTLQQNKNAHLLRVEGMVPLIDVPAFSSELTVLMNDKPVLTKQLGVGEFALTIAVPEKVSKQRIDLRFSKNQRLPNGDNRLAAAVIKFVGFVDATPPEHLGKFPDDLDLRSLEYSGMYRDGWVARSASFTLMQNKKSQVLRVEGSIPLIKDPSFKTSLTVIVDGKQKITKSLGLGEFVLTIPLPDIESRRRIDLQFSKDQRLSSEDNRSASAMIKFIGFKNVENSSGINMLKGMK